MRSVTCGAVSSSGTVSTFCVARRREQPAQRAAPPAASTAIDSAASAAAIAAGSGADSASRLATTPTVACSASESAHCGRTQCVSTHASCPAARSSS